MNTVNLNAAQLREASEVATQIEALQQRLASILGGTVTAGSSTVAPTATPGKRHLSPAARKKIAEGQARRWAKVNAEKAVAANTTQTPAPNTVPAPVAEAPAAEPFAA